MRIITTIIVTLLFIIVFVGVLGFGADRNVLAESLGDFFNTQQAVDARLPGAGKTVIMARADWPTGYFQAAIYAELLRRLGYEVTDPAEREFATTDFYPAIARGEVDLWVNGWFPSHNQYLLSENTEGQLLGNFARPVGTSIASGAIQGLVIDAKGSREHGIESLSQLAKNSELVDLYDTDGNGRAEIYGCPIGWGCHDLINDLIDANGPDTLEQISLPDYGDAFNIAKGLIRADQPVMIYTWTPNFTVKVLRPGIEVFWLDVTPADYQPFADIPSALCTNTPCNTGWVVSSIRPVANRAWLERNPAAEALLEVVQLPLNDITAQNLAMDEGETQPEDIQVAVDEWFSDNRTVILQWLDYARTRGVATSDTPPKPSLLSNNFLSNLLRSNTSVSAQRGLSAGSNLDINLNCGLGNGEVATGEPIAIAAIVSQTGPDNLSSSALSAKAFFDCINVNGGIHGHPVQYLIRDDFANPDVSTLRVRSLVEQSNVTAFIGSASFVDCVQNADYYREQNIIVIPATGTHQTCFDSPNIAPTDQGLRKSAIGIASYAAGQQGAESIVCFGQDGSGPGQWVCDGVEAWGKASGVEVETFLTPLNGEAIEDAYHAAHRTQPDAYLTSFSAPYSAFLLGIAELNNDTTTWYGTASNYDRALPDSSGDFHNNSFFVELELAPLTLNNSDDPGLSQVVMGTLSAQTLSKDDTLWQTVLDEFGHPEDPRDTLSRGGFLAAKIFVDTLLAIPEDKFHQEFSRAMVTEALQSVTNYESDLLCMPWSFELPDATTVRGRVAMQVPFGNRWLQVQDCFEIGVPNSE
ncbi:MAG: glycine betaine/L-proline ABC transporter substrate-binding protein ProX [Chloroflexota bacterium]